MTDILTDAAAAKAYLEKIKNCKKIGVEFSLTFAQYRRLWNTKKCYYTGVLFPERGHDWSESEKARRSTLDRVDNSKGYVTGNVVACTYTFNQLKSLWENPSKPLTEKSVRSAMLKLKRRSA